MSKMYIMHVNFHNIITFCMDNDITSNNYDDKADNDDI